MKDVTGEQFFGITASRLLVRYFADYFFVLVSFVGAHAWNFITDPRLGEEVVAHDSQIARMILSSNLLSGGLEPSTFSSFSEEKKDILKALAVISEDKRMQLYLEDSESSQEELQLLKNVIHEGLSKPVDKIVEVL